MLSINNDNLLDSKCLDYSFVKRVELLVILSRVPVHNVLFTGPVPVHNVLFTGPVPVHNVLPTGTIPVYNFFL